MYLLCVEIDLKKPDLKFVNEFPNCHFCVINALKLIYRVVVSVYDIKF